MSGADLINKVTILLTLKGRTQFTLRWLWHVNRTGLPFRIFVADGEPHPAISGLLEGNTAFPNLRLVYGRYNDRSYRDFYGKLVDALRRIDTPYVMLVDNDDFILPRGVLDSVAFLDAHPDYVCAGGGIPHFELKLP